MRVTTESPGSPADQGLLTGLDKLKVVRIRSLNSADIEAVGRLIEHGCCRVASGHALDPEALAECTIMEHFLIAINSMLNQGVTLKDSTCASALGHITTVVYLGFLLHQPPIAHLFFLVRRSSLRFHDAKHVMVA